MIHGHIIGGMNGFSKQVKISPFGFLTKHDCVVNFVNAFSEWVYFSYGIQRDRVCCYFDNKK